MSHPFPSSLPTKKWTCQLCRYNNRPNSSQCVSGARHHRAALVRYGGTALGFRQLRSRTARPDAQPRQERPWRANRTSGNGEGQRTAHQSKPKGKNRGTSEPDAQSKCVRAQFRLCNDAGRDTESLQSELQGFSPLSQKSLGCEPSCLKKRTSSKWELAKANASDISLDNILSGFVSSVHTRRALSANTEGSQTRASDRIHSIFGVCLEAP